MADDLDRRCTGLFHKPDIVQCTDSTHRIRVLRRFDQPNSLFIRLFADGTEISITKSLIPECIQILFVQKGDTAMRQEDNKTLTGTGPGTPAGDWMRLYWQPVALSEELDTDRAAVPVRVLGEDLVLFRNEDLSLGLIDRRCAHRGADLSLGRLEDGGLRCYFHGWLFEGSGQCLQTPAEPDDSPLASKVKIKSYPVVERNGIMWGYLGTETPPKLPALDCFAAPEDYTFAFKGFLDCNWLQALEVGIDPAHASYLHRFENDEDTEDGYGKQFRNASLGTDLPMTKILREYSRPEISNARTEYGQRIVALRTLDKDGLDGSSTHVRISHQVFPHGITIPLSSTIAITQWHVPIDDTSCYWYAMFTSLDEPVDKELMRAQRIDAITLPDYKPVRNRANQYQFDAEEQRTETYTGLGKDINAHDQMAVEGQGYIYDRSREHLSRSDRAIVTYRRMVLSAIEAVAEGRSPHTLLTDTAEVESRGPIPLDGIGPTGEWESYWAQSIADLRKASPWASELVAALTTGPAGIPGSPTEPDRSQSTDAYDRTDTKD
ncbi:aromatic ring-hydroxylating dioxygenase subunit alpha [Rhodococcus ruber]|uniref:Aromatic ring-hydroxylating dioxygenase subunit alpha n=1 Tax=Rhodococcus ruber TaxID=1830 RepID=A0ABT4MEP0_9NOCA|nr:aromatic ring-hydroxylating dioxygenase subunit alpha [Rhodococcus ruber]MCZ4519432.1 aromatic ring-hydroxylating dioxygenase subunit alpha [Rhodococcus ruber]